MVVIVLPAYNEEETVPLLINRILSIGHKRFNEGLHVVVVDDGSSDLTSEKVIALNCSNVELIKHAHNRGLGEAIKTGLLHALKVSNDVEVIVTMDSDNTHTPGLLMRMIMALDEGNDVVIASRYRPGARILGLSWHRQFLSLAMSWLFRIFIPISGVRDFSCGYRAYRAEILRGAFEKWGDKFINQSGFSCMVDILFKLNKLDAIMTEVPLILRYDFKHGKSKMKVLKTVKETLNLAWREFVQRRLSTNQV